MGRPMVDRLLAAGHDVTILTRRVEARLAAEGDGLACAATVPETVRDADVVISIVLNDEQVRDALLGDAGAVASMSAGAILVQHTTCDPETMEQVAAAGAERGVRVLDAAVSGNPRDTAAGDLTVWVGGDPDVVEHVRPVLETYASPLMHVGPVGKGQLVKLVNNALFIAQVGLAVDAARLAGSIGISERDIFAAVQHGSGGSQALSSVAWIGVDAVGPRLAELMQKDVDVVRDIAGRADLDLGLIGDVLSSAVVEETVLCGGTPPPRQDADRSSGLPGAMKS
jgi:3-hydroxyisobutyrate dehydrogenase-like beta-hydroxyacid dehydrogenase